MSVFLVTSSFVTTLLIPPAQFEPGGHANGRALAYLAHEYLGNAFGTTYDASTIAILWFAGASAMAGMLNLIPRYLPRYGMSPEWAGAVRPLVLILTGTAFLITWIFDASVDGQGGAYATGVLVLFTSAGVAVTLAARRAGQRKRMSASPRSRWCFAYTTVSNVIERPDGVKIGACFVLAIVVVSVALADQAGLRAARHRDRLRRRRARSSSATARDVRSGWSRTRPSDRDVDEYVDKLRQLRRDHDLPTDPDVIFVEVTVVDPSDFEGRLHVRGEVAPRALPGDDGDGTVGPQRPCRPGSPDPRRHRRHPAHLLRVDRGQPGPAVPALPALRARRGRAGHPRGAAPGRARPGTPAARARRLRVAVAGARGGHCARGRHSRSPGLGPRRALLGWVLAVVGLPVR